MHAHNKTTPLKVSVSLGQNGRGVEMIYCHMVVGVLAVS